MENLGLFSVRCGAGRFWIQQIECETETAGCFAHFVIGHNSPLYDSRFTDHDSPALGARMHLDFANLLNLVSTITLIGALVFTGLQVRAANRARREQAAVTMIETAALSENSARFLELLSEIPEGASAAVIEKLDAETRRQIFLFGLRVEVIGYMVFHGLVDVQTVNDLAGGAILSFWSRAKSWSEERRKRTGHDEFLEWCEWLVTQIAQYRATRPYVPAYSRAGAGLAL
jgi:hypothetical protein